MKNEIIKLTNINKYYNGPDNKPFQALKNVSLSLYSGEFVAILGKSGAGKSTLLHILELIDDYNDGTFLFMDKNVKTMTDEEKSKLRNEKIGIVLQSYGLLGEYTVIQNVMFPLYFGKYIKKKNKISLAEDALSKVNILDLKDNQSDKLSGGQMQRVSIARALINNPSVIFLDEPTGALDEKTGLEIMNLLIELKNNDVCIVMVTHNEKFAGMADRIIKINDGKIIDNQ